MTREVLTLGRAISLWERSLAAARKAPRTIEGYVRSCEYLEDALGRDIDPTSITIEDLESVLARASFRRLSPTTVHNRMVAWREFFHWGARRYGWPNPAALLDLPKKDDPQYRRLSTAEIDAMLAADVDARAHLTVMLLAHLGIRRQELMSLRWSHVDLVNATATIDHQTAKGRKGRTIPLPNQLVDLLARTKDERGDARSRPGMFVIPYRRGGQWQTEDERTDYTRGIADNAVYRLIGKAARSAGVPNPEQVTPHMFRRHLAEVLLDQGVSPYVVAALLGHASIRTTQMYGGRASLRAVRDALAGLPLRDTEPRMVERKSMELSGIEPLNEAESEPSASGSEPRNDVRDTPDGAS